MLEVLQMLGISGATASLLLVIYVLVKKYIKNSSCRTKDDGTLELKINNSPKIEVNEIKQIKEDIEKIKHWMNTTNPDGLEIV